MDFTLFPMPGHPRTYLRVFHSLGAFSHTGPVLIVIQGGSVAQAGVWATRLLLHPDHGLRSGGQIELVRQAHKRGYAVVLLNANEYIPNEVDMRALELLTSISHPAVTGDRNPPKNFTTVNSGDPSGTTPQPSIDTVMRCGTSNDSHSASTDVHLESRSKTTFSDSVSSSALFSLLLSSTSHAVPIGVSDSPLSMTDMEHSKQAGSRQTLFSFPSLSRCSPLTSTIPTPTLSSPPLSSMNSDPDSESVSERSLQETTESSASTESSVKSPGSTPPKLLQLLPMVTCVTQVDPISSSAALQISTRPPSSSSPVITVCPERRRTTTLHQLNRSNPSATAIPLTWESHLEASLEDRLYGMWYQIVPQLASDKIVVWAHQQGGTALIHPFKPMPGLFPGFPQPEESRLRKNKREDPVVVHGPSASVGSSQGTGPPRCSAIVTNHLPHSGNPHCPPQPTLSSEEGINRSSDSSSNAVSLCSGDLAKLCEQAKLTSLFSSTAVGDVQPLIVWGPGSFRNTQSLPISATETKQQSLIAVQPKHVEFQQRNSLNRLPCPSVGSPTTFAFGPKVNVCDQPKKDGRRYPGSFTAAGRLHRTSVSHLSVDPNASSLVSSYVYSSPSGFDSANTKLFSVSFPTERLSSETHRSGVRASGFVRTFLCPHVKMRLICAWQRKARRLQMELASRVQAVVFSECPAVLDFAMEGIGWGLQLLADQDSKTKPQCSTQTPSLFIPSDVRCSLPLRVKQLRKWLVEHCIHYVASDRPLETPLNNFRECTNQVPVISSGTIEHDLVPSTILESVFTFFEKMLQPSADARGNGTPEQTTSSAVPLVNI